MNTKNFVDKSLPWFLVNFLIYDLVGTGLETWISHELKEEVSGSKLSYFLVFSNLKSLLWIPFLILVYRLKRDEQPWMWVIAFALLHSTAYLILIGYELLKSSLNQAPVTSSASAPPLHET